MESSLECDERVMDVVADALQQPLEDRQAFVRTACKGDEGLLCAVREALAWEENNASFLSAPWMEFTRLTSPFAPGEVRGAERFEIVREIGEGGMGVVYEAFDRKLQQRIAIKAAKPGFQRLLSPELRAALRVSHHNICRENEIYTVPTEWGDIDFLTMELIEGETLAARLESEGAFPEAAALDIARQLCAGLAEAHRSGIVHRDLKTANVLLCRNEDGSTRAVITDFGLAGIDTDPNVVAGTPRYIAPELWQGAPPSKASDIYALGVILYEIAQGPEAKWRASANDVFEVPDLEQAAGALPARWMRVIQRCLSPSPKERPGDATQVIAGLEKRRRHLATLLAIPLLAAVSLASPKLWSWVHNLIWPPPSLRLVMLPPAGAESDAIASGGALQDVARRLSNLRSGTRSVVVIPPSDAKDLGVGTPAQAQKALHATHALETSAAKEGDDTVVQGSIVDLETQTHVRNFSLRYTPATISALPGALAGEVSSGLGLQGAPTAETLSPGATGPYDRGLYLFQQLQSNEEAMRLFHEAASLDPRSTLPLTALVEAETESFHETKDASHLARAQQYLESAESLNPDSVSVHLAAGSLYEMTGKLEKALDEYLRVRSLAPANIKAVLRAAWIYDRLDMPDNAIAEYRRAVALDPSLFETYVYFGSFYFYRGDYSAAAEQYRKETELAPGSYRAWSDLAVALKRLGQYDAAEQALRKGLQLREHPDLLSNMGALLSAQGRDAEAVPYYERAATLKPGEYVIWYNLADSNRRVGHLKAAREGYQRGLRLAEAYLQQNPQSTYARSYVATLAARLGQRSRALDETAQALHAAPSDAVVVRHAVLTYELLGVREKALECVTNATLEVLRDLQREPDLADFCHDPRFQQLVAVKQATGGK